MSKSEHEAELREALVRLRNIVNTEAGLTAADAACEALDALLVERRAEVKELQTLLVGKKAGALEVYAAGEVDAKVDAASDAALEEAARQYEAWAAENCQHESPTPEKRIRALKLQPAERYLRESEVREVLSKDATPTLAPVGLSHSEATAWANGHAFSRRTAAADLGVDLDAKSAATEADVYEQGGFIPPEGKR